ncbi:hypothetical protein ANN_14969 [Periplaneta americana]|uniref:Endonuclease/exonuclease/phosphatase domain-containing protein n=1 Tax=Periplaneta americana TaxID=6978 RepID=A0ABQ8SYE1_PERAM|nr:hypothetical protein ANN_14969 [Periplaneta americana]
MRGGPPAWGLGEGLTTHHRKKQLVTNPSNKPRNGTDSVARPQQRNKVLRFGTWNVTSLYRTGEVTLVAKELARYRIDFVGVQEVRKIFGAKRDEFTGEWRKLHNTELHALYPAPDIIRNIKSKRLRWAGHVARMGESRNAYSVLVGRPEGKRPLGRQRRRWEDNIKMDLRELGYDDRDWINLAQNRDQWWAYVRAAMNLRMNEDDEESSKGTKYGKNYVRFVDRRNFSLIGIEPSTALVFFGSEDNEIDDCGKTLDNKFHFLLDYRKREKKVGEAIRIEKRGECLFCLVVKKKSSDEFSYKNFEKCLYSLRKYLKNDQFFYVGVQSFRTEDDDPVTMEKIISVLKNCLTNSSYEVHICWPKEFENDCKRFLAQGMPSERDFTPQERR